MTISLLQTFTFTSLTSLNALKLVNSNLQLTMPPKSETISVPDASFMVLIADSPHQDLFGSVFGFPVLPDLVLVQAYHFMPCPGNASVPPAMDKASVVGRWLRYVDFLMLDYFTEKDSPLESYFVHPSVSTALVAAQAYLA